MTSVGTERYIRGRSGYLTWTYVRQGGQTRVERSNDGLDAPSSLSMSSLLQQRDGDLGYGG